MIEKMLELARQLAAVGEGEMEVLRLLCAGAERELRARLRPGLSPEECGEAFPLAGAWLALAGLEGTREEPASFSAGDLTVRSSGRDRSGWYREQAWETLRPWMRDESFSFRGVRG